MPSIPTPDTGSHRSRLLLTHALQLLNTALDVKERLKLLARIIADYLAVDDVAIFLREPGSDVLVLRESVGLDPIALNNIRVPIGKGITGTVAETRRYIATRNTLEDPRNLYSVYFQDENYPSMLSFPILAGDELIGVVNIRSRKEREFTEREAEELNNFTAGIAQTILNAQQYERLEYKAQLLELSVAIAGAITSSLDLEILLEDVAWEISRGFSIPGVVIHLMDEGGTVTKTSSHGLKPSFVKGLSLEGIRTCFESGEPRIRRMENVHPFGDASRDTWTISLPLTSRRETLGVLSLFGPEEPEGPAQELFLSAGVDVLLHIAGLTALAIENAAIHTEVKRLADVEKRKLDEIATMYSRISAIVDAITDGIVGMDAGGRISDFNQVAGKLLGLSDADRGRTGIDDITSYKPPLSEALAAGRELANRVVSFAGKTGKFAALVTMRVFSDPGGARKGGVISFRPMEETVKMLSRFTSQRPRFTFEDIIGHDSTLKEEVRIARIAAQSSSNILIQGESGTGKELFSQSIHNDSPFADGPFIPVNCAAIPKDLIESELFGYAEGAFTGARKGGYIGKFEQATGGTIFLDEIGDMPLDTQVKLLRVLQDKVIQRVGAEHSIPINTRVLAATNRDLEAAIRDGTFREELYWRLNVVNITIPPLRDRRADIPVFIGRFIERFAKQTGKEVTGCEPGVLERLIGYSWGGNVRELENAIEHAVLITQHSRVGWEDLPATLRERINEDGRRMTAAETGSIEQARRERFASSKKLYSEAINQAGGDVEMAAQRLGMSRATLYRRLRKYGLTEDVSQIRQNIRREKNRA